MLNRKATKKILGLLEIVWMNFKLLAVESPLAQGLAEFSEVRKLGMNWQWEERGGWWMCTASPHFVRGRQYEGCSGIPRSGSCGSCAGEKNGLWSLWAASHRTSTIARPVEYATSPVATLGCTWRSRSGACACRSCGSVKQEKLPWLANNPFYTKRFAFYVGRRCRASTSEMWLANFASIGRRSRRWKWSTCASNSDGPGHPARR